MPYEDIKKILEYAIKIELTGRDTYRRLMREVENKKVVTLLRFLEMEEESHYQALLKKYKIYGGDPVNVTGIIESEMEWLKDLSSKDEKGIIKTCIESEKSNAEYYEYAATESSDTVIRDFFNFLGQQERHHADSLNDLLKGDTII